ncbi:nuclear body protein SP140-like protein isoform X2 [Larimichthys crocea]|uniref:nuclear body protein SP140-like protein isoform X2 n=1 Tax=Larimichthys crocea TaxID=215358 RepID=UPI000F5DB883|nr:nuclear body protein SP140-like protein isoform X2 [Larimichthys crocea]
MVDLHFLEDEELLQFFHCQKTEMSCMDKPQIFLDKLKDYDLIPEDTYEKLSRMKSKDNLRKALYDFLDWLEKKHPEDIRGFWTCVFTDTIVNKYPTLLIMRNSLKDGSFQFNVRQAEQAVNKETDKGKRKEVSEDEEKEEKKANSGKKKRKLRRRRIRDDDDDDEEEEEQAGPSSQSTPNKKKKVKINFSPSLKRGEKSEIWNWPMYKHQLPVTCGQQSGYLNRDRLAKGEKCIVVEKQWFTPGEFEKFSGKSSSRNWKLSIRCRNVPLGKLIKGGHLKSGRYKGGCKKAKKALFQSDDAVTVSEGEEDGDEEDGDEEDGDEDEDEESDHSSKKSSTNDTEEEETEEQPGPSHDRSNKVYKVTCGALEGTLHEKRFASGSCGKSIRTEASWLTPMEFLKEASCQTGSWRKDIKCEGKPLGVLTEEYEKNDDECYICKNEGEEEEELVMCDNCPRSFHQKCHLPHIDDAVLGDGTLWMCTFCVFKSNEECFYKDELKREAAMSNEISQHMLKCQYLLLCLFTADEERTFATDPSRYLSDYSAVVKTPMWLGKVADKLENQVYKTVGEFVSDVELIFTNCASYNRDNAEYHAMGNRLKELFDRDFRKVFNVSD